MPHRRTKSRRKNKRDPNKKKVEGSGLSWTGTG